MEPGRLQEIELLYHAALEREEGQRAVFLSEACGSDEALRNEVESLLACSGKAEHFIETTAMELAARAIAKDQIALYPAIPASIGRYRILRVLGEGGMGTVYEAEQDNPRRIVALKVIKPGLAGSGLLRRFEQESHALARLQHPGIAQIFEAGSADIGFGPQPYFALEFIMGESLLQYAEAHRLNTRQRLDLMARVCEGVHHAHQRGIIHRDLKPGNILVDESGQPKVLDFGVARVTGGDVQSTRQTEVGQLVGTLAYMSPEQVLADPLELDTRSDVYALGIILFELLAGCLPYTVDGQLHQAVRTIREEEPTPLSRVNRVYRGDIETIVAKALEKDKNRRYASAAGMAGDLRRYLNCEPIVARPPSATYQLQKFALRHKALVAGGTAVFAVLIAGIVASTWEATRARRAEQTARTESATAKAINDFLENDLLAQAGVTAQAGPGHKPDPDLKVRTALDRAAAQVEGKFKGKPLVEASIRQTIGKTYGDLGLYPEAQRQLERALDLRQRVLGSEHPSTLLSMNVLAALYHDQARYSQAEPLLTKVLEVRSRLLGEGHPDTLETMNDLSLLYQYQGKYARAEPLSTRVLEVRRRMLGWEHPDTLNSTNTLALLYVNQGRYEQAEPLFTWALEAARRVLGEEYPGTLFVMSNLAMLYTYEGKYPQAEALSTQVLEVRRRLLGEEHPDTLNSMNTMAQLYRYQGKYQGAEALYTRILEVEPRVLGEEHHGTLIIMNNLAALYRDQQRYSEGERLFIKVLDVEGRVLGEEHPDRLNCMYNLARLYQDEGKDARAEALLIQVVELQRRVLGPEHPRIFISMNDLALLYLQHGKYSRGAALLQEALNSQQKNHTDTWDRYNSQSLLGASLAGEKNYREAEPLLLSGYQGMLQREASIPAASRSKLRQAGQWIIQLYQDWGKPEKAALWTRKLQVTRDSVSAK